MDLLVRQVPGVPSMDALAPVVAQEGGSWQILDQAQLQLLLSFLGECCVYDKPTGGGSAFYVTYETGRSNLRTAFRDWLERQGHPLRYELPSRRSVAGGAFVQAVGAHQGTSPQRFRHPSHGFVKGAYRGYRLTTVDPQWYQQPLAQTSTSEPAGESMSQPHA